MAHVGPDLAQDETKRPTRRTGRRESERARRDAQRAHIMEIKRSTMTVDFSRRAEFSPDARHSGRCQTIVHSSLPLAGAGGQVPASPAEGGTKQRKSEKKELLVNQPPVRLCLPLGAILALSALSAVPAVAITIETVPVGNARQRRELK